MRQIFVFTAGDKQAREHLVDSILNPVPWRFLEEELPPNLASRYLTAASESPDGFYAWGAVPGLKNLPNWTAMQVGDVVLTMYENKYHFISTVVEKIESVALATKIWGTNNDGQTWQYMYLLSRPKPIDTATTSRPAADYLRTGYRGFTKISDPKIHEILKDYGSLEAFIASAFGEKAAPADIDAEMKQIAAEAEQASFDPENMADGRRRVLQDVVRRQGQPKFRRLLLAAYAGRCAITGCDVESVLEAAHISPYLGKDSNSVQNGLLLRADIHTLFDLGALKIAANGRIEIDEMLIGTIYGAYEGQSIRMPDKQAEHPSPRALALKYTPPH